jgi:hypothetical protein
MSSPSPSSQGGGKRAPPELPRKAEWQIALSRREPETPPLKEKEDEGQKEQRTNTSGKAVTVPPLAIPSDGHSLDLSSLPAAAVASSTNSAQSERTLLLRKSLGAKRTTVSDLGALRRQNRHSQEFEQRSSSTAARCVGQNFAQTSCQNPPLSPC